MITPVHPKIEINGSLMFLRAPFIKTSIPITITRKNIAYKRIVALDFIVGSAFIAATIA